MLLNEKGKFALTFKIETKLRDQGTSLLRKSLFLVSEELGGLNSMWDPWYPGR
jgi:hypothetical protein